jgi:hypothetical protein
MQRVDRRFHVDVCVDYTCAVERDDTPHLREERGEPTVVTVRPERAEHLAAFECPEPVQREEREEEPALAPRKPGLDASAVDENRQRAAELDLDPCQLNANIVPSRLSYNAGVNRTEGDP